MPRPVFTHFIDVDQPGKRTARALCGELVERRLAVAHPTCTRCDDLLHIRDRIVDALSATKDHPADCDCVDCLAAWDRVKSLAP